MMVTGMGRTYWVTNKHCHHALVVVEVVGDVVVVVSVSAIVLLVAKVVVVDIHRQSLSE